MQNLHASEERETIDRDPDEGSERIAGKMTVSTTTSLGMPTRRIAVSSGMALIGASISTNFLGDVIFRGGYLASYIHGRRWQCPSALPGSYLAS